MRQLEPALLRAQKDDTFDPRPKIVLTKGADVVTFTHEEAIVPEHLEEPFRVNAKVVIDNSEHELSNKNFKGYRVGISYGYLTRDGLKYSLTSPLTVVSQEIFSGEEDYCELRMIGIPDMLSLDRASEGYYPRLNTETGLYEPAGSGDKNVKTLITEILEATFPCYTHCRPYEIVWGNVDGLMNSYKPRAGFRIYINGRRLAALKRLLNFTKCVMLFLPDGKIKIFQPTTSGTDYEYEYSAETGHLFFAQTYQETVVIPNYIIVKSRDEDPETYSGFAKDQDSIDALANAPTGDTGERRWYVQTTLDSNAQATQIAEAVLSNFKLGAKLGAADVPMNCGAELFDYVKVTDEEDGTERVGNIGSIRRKFNPDKDLYNMEFNFGGWWTVGNLAAALELSEDFGSIVTEYKEEFYNYLYVEMLDVEFLSAISANMGLLTAGEIRIGEGILTPTGYATGGSQTTLVDSTASWTPDAYYGMDIRLIVDGVAYDRVILTNTTNMITFTEPLPEGVVVADEDSYYFGDIEVQMGDSYFIRGVGTGVATDGGKTWLIDSTKDWEENEHVGKYIRIIKDGQWFQKTIVSNSINMVTFTALGEWKPFTGFRLWTDGILGRIAGYLDGVIQYYTGSDGKFYAGNGSIMIHECGMVVHGDLYGSGYLGEITFQDGENSINYLTAFLNDLIMDTSYGSGAFKVVGRFVIPVEAGE